MKSTIESHIIDVLAFVIFIVKKSDEDYTTTIQPKGRPYIPYNIPILTFL
jgi:hypothetical protein